MNDNHLIEAIVGIEIVRLDVSRQDAPAGTIEQAREQNGARLAGFQFVERPRVALGRFAVHFETDAEIAERAGAGVMHQHGEIGTFAGAQAALRRDADDGGVVRRPRGAMDQMDASEAVEILHLVGKRRGLRFPAAFLHVAEQIQLLVRRLAAPQCRGRLADAGQQIAAQV